MECVQSSILESTRNTVNPKTLKFDRVAFPLAIFDERSENIVLASELELRAVCFHDSIPHKLTTMLMTFKRFEDWIEVCLRNQNFMS